ncbi:an1 zinc finger protein [Grosmannia clavigera kw1407]|uniref:An1 zinc finger protein n=1 Tax=Grosmannia clavigera (strain kw1407 / UAMH 11150) TaxID=655863 RepID=F0X8G7_GROCL|nr:an1 zinc finger protein [Grosmannia clavigera kw1407]EFX05772.1 an1 zinc finger protein [Grosmannia clavigera kw1407]
MAGSSQQHSASQQAASTAAASSSTAKSPGAAASADGGDDSTSYIKMAEVDTRPDATLTGKHCQFDYCNQLDFLPFYCQSCRKTFCLDHRTESAHRCENEGAWAQRRREAQLARPSAGAGRTMRELVAEKPCASPACKTVVGTGLVPGVHCSSCNRDYCLKHRLREDHNCAHLTPLGARPGGSAANGAITASGARAKSALDKLRAWGAAKKEQAGKAMPVRASPAAQSAAQRTAALADLRKTAKGDAKIAPEKRVHLYVEAEATSTQAKLPKGRFFYSRDWAVGRVLDAAARSLQIDNVNNQSTKEDDKLRVFHVEGGRLLDFNEKVGTVLANGNTIVLLRGIGPPPDLMDL